MSAKRRPSASEARFRAFVEEYKRNLTEEDMKWYEQEHELVALADIIKELESYVKRRKKD